MTETEKTYLTELRRALDGSEQLLKGLVGIRRSCDIVWDNAEDGTRIPSWYDLELSECMQMVGRISMLLNASYGDLLRHLEDKLEPSSDKEAKN